MNTTKFAEIVAGMTPERQERINAAVKKELALIELRAVADRATALEVAIRDNDLDDLVPSQEARDIASILYTLVDRLA